MDKPFSMGWNSDLKHNIRKMQENIKRESSNCLKCLVMTSVPPFTVEKTPFFKDAKEGSHFSEKAIFMIHSGEQSFFLLHRYGS